MGTLTENVVTKRELEQLGEFHARLVSERRHLVAEALTEDDVGMMASSFVKLQTAIEKVEHCIQSLSKKKKHLRVEGPAANLQNAEQVSVRNNVAT